MRSRDPNILVALRHDRDLVIQQDGLGRLGKANLCAGREHFAGHYHLPFVQLNVGLHDLLSSKLDLGVGLKVGGFLPDYQYHKFDSDGVEDLSKYEHYTTSNLLLEPQVMLRFGAPSFKFNVKVGVAWLSDFLNDSNNAHMIYDFVTASCGFTFSF